MSNITDLLNDIDAIIKEPIIIPRPKPQNDREIIRYIKDTLNTLPELPTVNDKINGFVELYEYFNEPSVQTFIHKHDKFKQVIIKKLKDVKEQYPNEVRITSLTLMGCELEEQPMSLEQPVAEPADDGDANHDS